MVFWNLVLQHLVFGHSWFDHIQFPAGRLGFAILPTLSLFWLFRYKLTRVQQLIHQELCWFTLLSTKPNQCFIL
jgi:hypothetical protein